MSYNIFSWEYRFKDDGEGVSAALREVAESMNDQIKNRNNTARVGFIYADGHHYMSDNTACHAGLYKYQKRKAPLKYAIAFAMKRHASCSRETEVRFVDWLINHSPYKEAFVDKDAEAIAGKYYLLNPLAPSNIMAGGAICTRFLSEDHNEAGMKVWEELINNLKVDGTKAFVFAHMFSGNLKNTYPIQCVPTRDTHNVIYFSRSEFKTITNFIRNNKVMINPPYVIEGTYSKIEALWGGGYDYRSEDYQKFCQSLKPVVITKHMSYNIFETLGKKVIGNYSPQLNNIEDLKSVWDQWERRMA